MKGRTIVIAGLLLVFCSALFFSPSVQAVDDIEDMEVLVLITDAFGWNYFDIVEIFEGWGINVTTASATLTLEVDSCYNKPDRPVTADILMRDIDNETLEQFDALIIPSGGQWQSLVSSRRNLDFISNAHARGLVIATMCIGNRVVCRANNIVNHTKVAYYAMTNSEMRDQGATVVSQARVVSNNRIITGGAGAGYMTGGHEGAPTLEVCSELVRTVMGVTCVESATVTPTLWNVSATYSVSVTVQDPATIIPELNSSIPYSVDAVFYPTDGFEAAIKTVSLTYNDDTGIFSGNFTDLRRGSYNMSVEVTTEDSIVEVVETDQVITYEEPAPPAGLGEITLFGGIAVAAVVVVAGVFILKKKR
ncbi:MAG: DJ-1/PfpI family protein [Candidatus Thorarchaeota archaeon]|jgi:putative intracellular protease/amidase